jgi:hypothetical protein
MRKTSAIMIGFLAAAAVVAFAQRASAKDKFFEVFLGAGGGYEYYKMTSASAKAIQNSISSDCAIAECIKPDEITGHGGLWRIFGGVRLGLMGIGIDYRQSYLVGGPISWGQLMGDFWIFLPIPIVKPFIKLGVGFIHLRARGVDLAGTTKDGDLVKGLGFRGGAGLLVKPIKWISVGATCEIVGTYFREGIETTWGYAVDVTAHLIVHI